LDVFGKLFNQFYEKLFSHIFKVKFIFIVNFPFVETEDLTVRFSLEDERGKDLEI